MDPEVIAAIIALVGVAISVWLSTLISQKSLYTNSVTVERSKWIDKLRENLSRYSGLARTLYRSASIDRTFGLSAEAKGIIADINQLVSLIKLQLNPDGDVDKTLLRLLERIPSLAEAGDYRLPRADSLLVEHAQWLLKNEWEKVKYESKWFGSRRASAYEERRRVAYIDFCRGHDIEEMFGSALTSTT